MNLRRFLSNLELVVQPFGFVGDETFCYASRDSRSCFIGNSFSILDVEE